MQKKEAKKTKKERKKETLDFGTYEYYPSTGKLHCRTDDYICIYLLMVCLTTL
jgi:hypothetical protein